MIQRYPTLLILAVLFLSGCSRMFVPSHMRGFVDAETQLGPVRVLCEGKDDWLALDKKDKNIQFTRTDCIVKRFEVNYSAGRVVVDSAKVRAMVSSSASPNQIWVFYDDYLILCPWNMEWKELSGKRTCTLREDNGGWVFPIAEYGNLMGAP